MKKTSEHILQTCGKAGFPKELLDFMSEYGFGNFGDGILKLIDPEDYMNSLYTWLGGEDCSCFKLAAECRQLVIGMNDMYTSVNCR
jgi:hypothetical protein